jgi:predicted RNA binding protein YcfA (HicA-like mRNA interferase family)
MSKLLTSAEIIRILEEFGFQFISQKGSHRKYRKGDHVVIIPSPKKEIPAGTFRSILRQSGLTAEDFIHRRRD